MPTPHSPSANWPEPGRASGAGVSAAVFYNSAGSRFQLSTSELVDAYLVESGGRHRLSTTATAGSPIPVINGRAQFRDMAGIAYLDNISGTRYRLTDQPSTDAYLVLSGGRYRISTSSVGAVTVRYFGAKVTLS